MYYFKNNKPTDCVELQDRAFQYGDGCFTTVKVVSGQPQLWLRHLKRLKIACAQLKLDANLELLDEITQLWKMKCAQSHGVIKVLISRGIGTRGYAIPQHQADIYVYFFPSEANQNVKASYICTGVLSQRIGLTMPSLIGIKSLNRLEQILLKDEAQKKNWSEAFSIDVQDNIVEGVSSNCFLLINNTWITPDLAYNGVHGVMRAEILHRMQKYGVSYTIAPIQCRMLDQVEAAFFCNALNPMQIVQSLNDQPLNTAIADQLFSTLQLDQMN